MRHGKTFCKRLLTFVLSLAMVLTSVNVPALTVQAAETGLEENEGNVALPTSEPSDDGTTPDDEEALPLDDDGDTDVEDGAGVEEDGNTDDDGGNLAGGGITAADSSLEKPTGVTANYVDLTGDAANDDFIGVTWSYSEDTSSITGWEIYVDGTESDNLITIASEKKETRMPIYWEGGDTEHKVYVRAVSEAGEGEFSDPGTFKVPVGADVQNKVDPHAPLAPVAFQVNDIPDSPTSRVFAWAPDSDSVNNGPKITSYKYYLDQDNNGVTATSGVRVDNLSSGSHTVKLVPCNEVGEGVPATRTFVVEGSTTDPTPTPGGGDSTGKSVLISEQLDQAIEGSDVTLKYSTTETDFKFESGKYTVTVDGVDKTATAGISVNDSEKSITLPASLFSVTKGDDQTFTIQFTVKGYDISPVYQRVYKSGGIKWNKDWNDEFDGDSLDTSKWDYQTGNGSYYGISGWGNEEKQIYTNSSDNTSVGGGKLTITAKKEANGGYTSARLRTVKEELEGNKAKVGTPLKIGTYGKVEAKIKMPEGWGVWPAFWMLPHDSEYGTWAASGEIDIMETRGREPQTVLGTIHYGNVWPSNASSGGSYTLESDNNITQYHIYTIEWEPTEMRWYVDGNLYYKTSNWYSVESESGNYPYPAPFDEEFYILLNLAVGGTFDSTANEAGRIDVDENGVDMDVDYVRWYQKDGGYGEGPYEEPAPEKDASAEATALLKEADKDGNFIKDSDFSKMNTTPITDGNNLKIERGYWNALLIPGNGGGAATWSKTTNSGKNYLKVDVTNVGSQTYSSQMIQYLPVIKGYSYEISYSAYTDEEKQKADVSLKIGGDDDNGWAVYSGNYSDVLTTTPTTYTHRFTMTGKTDPTARFEFNLATSAGTVYLSDVSVKIIDSISENDGEDDDKEPLSDGNHVYNGGFSNGSDGLLYWHWGTTTEPTDDSKLVSVVKENKERKAQITVESDAVSLWQKGINLLQTDEYELTFDIESDSDQTLTLAVTNADGTETYADNTSDDTSKNVTSGTKTVTWEFTQPKDKTDPSGRLVLTFEKSAKIDNVKLIRKTFNNLDYSQVELYPFFEDFSNGTGNWNIWSQGAGGYESKGVDDQGRLKLTGVYMNANANFYDVGIKSPSMTLTKGVKYKVEFDYTLPADKTYTLELGGAQTQREILLEASKTHYTSEAFDGSGGGEFALYLGPYESGAYDFTLDNVKVYADLPEKEGYKEPVTLAQVKRVASGNDVTVSYTGEMKDEWDQAESITYYLDGEEIAADKVTLNAGDDTITLSGELFPGEDEAIYKFSAKAEGYVATKTISLYLLDKAGNLIINSTFSSGQEGWSFWYADWNAGASFSVSEDGVAIVNHEYDGGTDSWSIQLSQTMTDKYDAGDYIVTFDAWADVERPIHVQMLPYSGAGEKLKENYVDLSTESKNYQLVWKGMGAGDGDDVFNIEFGNVTNPVSGATTPSTNHNIYLDNIRFRPYTQADKDMIPFEITSPGAGKVGEDVTVTYTGESESTKWKIADKIVYVNGVAIDPELVDDKKTNDDTDLTIKAGAFTKAGRYSIYLDVKGFGKTGTIYKNMIGADGNRIFGGDMNDASQWTVWDADDGAFTEGRIARGVYSLNYKQGKKDGYWHNWSSQLKKENISVEESTPYVLRFEATTDLAGGRDIVIEYTTKDGNAQKKVPLQQGGPTVVSTELTPDLTTDAYVINFLVGAVEDNADNPDPFASHTLTIDNVSLRPKSEEKNGLKAELDAVIAEYEKVENEGQGDYTQTSWDAFIAALNAARKVASDWGEDGSSVTEQQISEAINALKLAAEKLTPPLNMDALNAALKKYAEALEKAENPDSSEYKNFAKAYKYAEEIAKDAEKGNATQKEIDDAVAALEAAYKAYQDSLVQPVPEGLWIEWIDDVDEFYYTGAAIKPAFNVYFGETLLKIKTEYTVTYSNNKNASVDENGELIVADNKQPTIKITGKGNFNENKVVNFKIKQKDLGDEDITAADVYAVIAKNGSLKDPSVTVKYGNKKLTNKKDYTINYPDEARDENKKGVEGSYTITLTAGTNKNFKGEKTVSYTVYPKGTKALSSVSVKLMKTKVSFDDYEVPEIKSVTSGKTPLEAGTHYTIDDPVEETHVGKMTMTLRAVDGSGFYGTKNVTYTVTGTALKKGNVRIDEETLKGHYYTGEAITIDDLGVEYKTSEKDEDGAYVWKSLTEAKDGAGGDYTVTYSKNVNAGTAKLTIKGLASSGYTGSVSKSFKIAKIDLAQLAKEDSEAGYVSDIDLDVADSAVYTKSGAQPTIELSYNDMPLALKTHYTVSYKNNKKVTVEGAEKATVTITGKGNYTGKITKEFSVTTPDPDSIYVVAADKVMPAKASKANTTVKVYEKSTGKALKAGTDYEKSIKWGIGDDYRAVTNDDLVGSEVVINVEVTLKGNYVAPGTATESIPTIQGTYRLYTVKASTFKVDPIDPQYYNNGEPIKPELTVYNKDGVKLTEAKDGEDGDYTVTYTNNVKKGTAKATITGCGNGYGGTKTVKFTIKAKSMSSLDSALSSITDFFRNLF